MSTATRFFETSIYVRYAETDAMGIAHHSHFLTWTEYARIRWLDVLGIPYRELEKQGYFLPVVEAHVRYRKPVFFDDKLTIKLSILDPMRARFCVNYQILRDQEIIAEVKTVHAFVNAQKQLVRPPDHFLSLLDQWMKNEYDADELT